MPKTLFNVFVKNYKIDLEGSSMVEHLHMWDEERGGERKERRKERREKERGSGRIRKEKEGKQGDKKGEEGKGRGWGKQCEGRREELEN